MRGKEEEELEKIYNSYEKGEYTFGKYETEFDLEQAFFEGKTFVLKGSNNGIYLCILFAVIFLFGIILFLFIGGISAFGVFMSLGLSIALFSIEIPLIVLGIVIKRRFVVIGPSGVYYRRKSKRDFFLWKDVAPIIETKKVHLRYGMTTDLTIITIITPNNKKLRFSYGQYKKKEFPYLFREEMFYRLFQIYFKFGKLQRT
ncbi:MAG: hypothetical protein KAW66_10325 [Candidatus Lokiarchaeota archaeon]|nr:hypothetical protein [Candidatus Lokiarchaeota archaeon]